MGRGEDRKLHIAIERPREIDEFAIRARNERRLRQARTDLPGDLRGGGPLRDLAGRAVGQRDLNGCHFSFG